MTPTNFPWFPYPASIILYIPGRSDLAPVSDSELVAPPVELKTIRLPTGEDGSEHERCNGDREKSGCLGQLKDMIRRDS